MVRRVACIWLIVSLGLAPLAPGPAFAAREDAATAYERALALERAGEFPRALRTLEPVRLSGSPARHRAELRRAVAAFAAASLYVDRDQPALAAATLRSLGAQLDPVRDVYLRSAQARRLAAVPVAEQDTTGPGFFDDVWNGFADAVTTLASWLLVVAAVLLLGSVLHALLKRWRRARKPRPGVGIELEDLSAEAGRRTDANRTLSRELSIAIEAIDSEAEDAPVPEIDVAKDLDGGISVNVGVAADTATALDHFGDEPIKAGPLSFSPRQLAAFVAEQFARDYTHRLSGSLVSTGDRTEIVIELAHDGGSIRSSCTRTGSDSRATAIAEVAARVVYELGEKRVSARWPSVAAYRRARATLAQAPIRGDERRAVLEQARTQLEHALAHDPVNPLARFELGNVLRALGFNDEAVAQYDMLVVPSDAVAALALLRRAAAYSRAVALSKIATDRTHRRAIELLDELSAEVEADAALRPVDRDHLLALARSAKAAAQIFPLEALRKDDSEDGRRRRRELYDEIVAARDWIVETERRGDPRQATYYQALAVAENAVGRAIYLTKKKRGEAIDALEHALSLVPELGDAHVNLAGVLLRKPGSEPGWDSRIRRHLDRALEISPNDRKALYLHGRVCMELNERERAARWFEQAAQDGDAWALYRLGELSHDRGDLDAAVERGFQSFTHAQAADRRACAFVRWLAERPVEKVPEADVVQAAHRAGALLKRDAHRRGTELSDELRHALERVEAWRVLQPTG